VSGQGELPAADEHALLRVLVAVSQLLTDIAPLQALDFGSEQSPTRERQGRGLHGQAAHRWQPDDVRKVC
jgi:hypothetical protein